MTFQMLKTEKGKDMLCYDGHIFLKEKENGTKSIWKCNQYYKNKCRGRLHLSKVKILKNTDHNHVPSSSEIQIKKTLNKLKDIASNNSDMSTQSVIGSALNQIPIESSGQLPNINILKRTIQRVHKQKLQLPNDPTDLNFIIPDEMTKIIDENLFLQYDSGINI
ncbi:FLYWCH-type zinc finger-containing protein 1-like [Acyrthosiphon pisum]|uniref:FLYWCH-type domain-containing protein n=1 Tax=Acyrthosiphon pisum TaxID=7029 RepID=A0A8R2NLG2_ACYPI|nr:FLYWCH-type zinc finger-containing protein 1-like [Acyrthosiphon pisum]